MAKNITRGKIIGFGLVFLMIVICLVLLKVNLDKDEHNKYPDRGLPRIEISLNNASIEDIYREGKDEMFSGNNVNIYEKNSFYKYSDVEVKGRGNSTSVQAKKPYQIKFKTKVDLFGMGQMKKWVLLANYLDTSQIRNDVALKMAEMLGINYNSRGKFIELYINEKYQGVYYLVKKIEIGKESVNLVNKGGVLFEVDTLHKNIENCYTSYLEDCLVLKDTVFKDDNYKSQEAESFLGDFNEFEIALEKKDFEAVFQKIDIESFVKYYLLSEFTVNPDAYSSSFYLYRDGDGDKIHAGPVWDFDYALGNQQWVWQIDEDFFSPELTMIRKREAFGLSEINEDKNISKIFYYLMEMPEFEDEVKKVFQEKMLGRKKELLSEIFKVVGQVREAIEYDNKRWKLEGFQNEVIYLLDWVERRYDYFEQEYGLNKKSPVDFL